MGLLNRLRPLPAGEPVRGAARPRDLGGASVPLHAPPVSPGAAPEKLGRFSNGLKEFLWQLEGLGRGNMLDMGPAYQATLNYFIDRGFKVYTEDILSAWRFFLRDEEQQASLFPAGAPSLDVSPIVRAERFLASNLKHSPDTFDAVLLWDLLDYMDRQTVPLFLARLSTLVRDGGVILAVFHTRMPEQFHRYRILDAHNLELVPAPPLVQPRHIYQNREIQDLFERYRTSKTFVGRDQFREGVFVK